MTLKTVRLDYIFELMCHDCLYRPGQVSQSGQQEELCWWFRGANDSLFELLIETFLIEKMEKINLNF